MVPRAGLLAFVLVFTSGLATAQNADNEKNPSVPLIVPTGAPLRLYLTKRMPKRAGAPVEAKVMEPAFAFDREVVPAGTVAEGEVTRVKPVARWERVRAILGGDFTPLRLAEVEFTTLVLPNGQKVATHTVETIGLISIYREPLPRKKSKKQKPRKQSPQPQPQDQNGGILGTAKKTVKERINTEVHTRMNAINDTVRGPNKKERLVDFVWTKLPYHPQYLRRGTRFDALLARALTFGSEPIHPADLAALGTQPPTDSVVRVRLLTALDSASAKQGQAVEAVTAAPLYTADHKLILPEGTRLTGTVVVAKRARSFHRAGQLRFSFQDVDLPPEVARLRPAAPAPAPMKTQAILQGAENSGKAKIQVDSEGGVQAKESKTRFIAPVASFIVASRAADVDGRHVDPDAPGGYAGGGANVGGRTLGGGLGFGMIGMAVSQSSRYVGMAFGYYGLAWSIYANVIARGGEVQFDRNAMMDIKFAVRPAAPASKFRASAGTAGR
jgi:hypothetical protein